MVVARCGLVGFGELLSERGVSCLDKINGLGGEGGGRRNLRSSIPTLEFTHRTPPLLPDSPAVVDSSHPSHSTHPSHPSSWKCAPSYRYRQGFKGIRARGRVRTFL